MISPGPVSIGYTLRVAGRLEPHWATWFDGFTVTGESDGTTTLRGSVADQAQLHGLLAKIRDLGVALVSVEADPAVGGPDAAAPAQRGLLA